MQQHLQKVIIAADTAGRSYLAPLLNHCKNKDWEHVVIEYPDKDLYERMAKEVLKSASHIGILLAGSGIEANYYLNRINGIRAALTHNNYIAEMCRKHNDANIMVIPCDCLGIPLALSIVDSYYSSGFDGYPRNQKRVEKLFELEDKYSKK